MKKIAADRNYRMFKRAKFSPFGRLLEVVNLAPSREDKNHYISNNITFDDQKFIIANPADPGDTTECDYNCIWKFIYMLHEEERIFDKLPQTFGPMVSQNTKMESIRDSIREPKRNELIPTKLNL